MVYPIDGAVTLSKHMPNVDEESLNSLLARLVASPEERRQAANEYMPEILNLVSTNPQGADIVPEGLVPILLEGCPLQEVLQYIPPQVFAIGLEMDTLQGGLLDQLAKVTAQDLQDAAVGNLCKVAVGLLKTPSFKSVGKVEAIASRLNQFGVLRDYIPFEALYTGDALLRSRLMALNVLLAKSGHFNQEFMLWPLNCPDILESLVRCEYYAALVEASSRVLPFLDGVLHDAAKLLKSQVQPLLLNVIEQLFVNVARADAETFADFDKRYKLVETDSITLLARLPPTYVKSRHSDLVEQLQLSSKTLPAFCNLAADDSTFDLLHFAPKQLTALPLDLRLPLMIAATNDRKTAQRFVGRYHKTMQGVLEPSSLPEIADMQTKLEFNLRKAGLSLGFVRVTSSTN